MNITPKFGGYYVFPVQGNALEMKAADKRVADVIRQRDVAGRHGCFGLEEISIGQDHFLVKKTYDFRDAKVQAALQAQGIPFEHFSTWEEAKLHLVENALLPRIQAVIAQALPVQPNQIEFLKGLKSLATKLEALGTPGKG